MELPGRCGDWLDTATVTAQGSRSRPTRRTRDADFYLATNADLDLATNADFLMAMDNPAVTVVHGEHVATFPGIGGVSRHGAPHRHAAGWRPSGPMYLA